MGIIFAIVMLVGATTAAENAELCIHSDRSTLTQAQVSECESYAELHDENLGWNLGGMTTGAVIVMGN